MIGRGVQYLYYVPTEWSKKKHENMWRIGPLCWPENKRSPFYALLRSDTDFQTQPAGVNIEIHKNKQWVPDDSIKIELIFGTVKGRKKQAEHKITRNPHPISGKGWLTRRIFLFTGQRPLLTLTVLNLLNMLAASAIYTHLELDYEVRFLPLSFFPIPLPVMYSHSHATNAGFLILSIFLVFMYGLL